MTTTAIPRRQYGRRPTAVPDETQQRLLANVSALVARSMLAGSLGKQYSGDRDVYTAAGYPIDIQFEDYLGKYLREDVAQRVVNAPAEETWRRPPIIYDNNPGQDADQSQKTPFTQAILDLTDIERVPDNIEAETPNLWDALAQADKLAGIGEYGVLVLGINDGSDRLSMPLKAARDGARGTKALLYLTPLAQGDAVIKEWETNESSPRYGRPTLYACQFATEGQAGISLSTKDVHWTRIIHIAENASGTGVFGLPRLQAVYNRLEDLLKAMAGSGEAAWRLMHKGIIASTRDGYRLDDDDDETQDKVDEYIHDLRRFLTLEGMDVNIEGGEIVDPSNLVKIIIALISAATGIPQRILLGSERGELASSQDETAWKESIQARQVQFAEPRIVRKLINRLVHAGVLPMPENGRYTIEWPSLFEPTEMERAEINQKRASIIVQLSPPGAPDQYVGEDEARALALLPPRQGNPTAALLDVEDGQPNE